MKFRMHKPIPDLLIMKFKFLLIIFFSVIPATNTGLTNYYLINAGFELLEDEPAKVTITGTFTVSNKTYDGNTEALIITNNLVIDGVEEGDDVSLANITVEFSDKNAGTDKLVTIVSAELEGVNAEDYSISLIGAPGTVADITPRALTLSGFTADDKTYDATTDVQGAGFDDDRIEGDILEITFSVQFDDKNAGEDKTVTFSDFQITGEDQQNYSLLTETGQATATITPRETGISGTFTVSDKLHDGTTGTTIENNTLALSHIIEGDDVTLVDIIAEFLDPEAGTDKPVTIISVGLAGIDAPNYNLTLETVPTTTAEIRYSPVINIAEYNSATGELTISGAHLRLDLEIDITKIKVSNGDNTYTFTKGITRTFASSPTQATITLSALQKAFMNWILNNNGTRSKSNQLFSLSADENWNGMAFENPATPVAIFNFSTPSILSATYNRLTAELKVTASRLAANLAPENDIDVSRFTITGKDSISYTLTSESPDVDVISDSTFVIYVEGEDKVQIDRLIDIDGYNSSTGHPYIMTVRNRWNRPVHPDYDISDQSGKQLLGADIANEPPVASDVHITGDPGIGMTLTGNYTYSDLENDPEGNSVFRWIRADDADGTNAVIIEDEMEISYTLTLQDASKHLAFEVTPVARSGSRTGETVRSPFVRVLNAPPSVSDLEIKGEVEVCKVLTVSYLYSDPEDDPEAGTEIRWFRSEDDDGTNMTEIHQGSEYTLTIEDEGNFISVGVTPGAATGATPGETVRSQLYGPVINTLPTVFISGPADFCQGSQIELAFNFTGKAPWTVIYTDGNEEFGFTTSDNPFVLSTETGGSYEVIRLTDADGCEGTEIGSTFSIKEIPVIILSEAWYTESFDEGQADWVTGSKDNGPSGIWTFGLPEEGIFTSASSGQNIWYTDLANSDTNEQSWVTGPCFNFSGVRRPMITVDLWKEFTGSNEGAVLQYSDDNGNSWNNIGGQGTGINWYNSSRIEGRPGDQMTGWTISSTGENMSEWIEVRHDLDDLVDNEYVRFRFAYGSDGSSDAGGIAFDNIRISEREHLVLLEHFTNANDERSKEAGNTINNIVQNNRDDIVTISYHTSFPSPDRFNELNTAGPAARVFYYGINSVPWSLLNGGTQEAGSFDHSDHELRRKDIILRSLIDPGFSISVSTNQFDDELNIRAEIISLIDQEVPDLTLHLAIIETEIASSVIGLQGEHIFRNVVRRLLPDAGGTPISPTWKRNQAEIYDFNWTIENIFDPGNLAIVVFVQNERTRQIYQSAVVKEFGVPLSSDELIKRSREREIVIYPNPVTDKIFIRFNDPVEEPIKLEVYNVTGNIVFNDIINEGQIIYELIPDKFPRGTYLFRITNSHEVLASEKIVVIR